MSPNSQSPASSTSSRSSRPSTSSVSSEIEMPDNSIGSLRSQPGRMTPKAYNPSQPIDQRRELRRKYRELTRETHEDRHTFLTASHVGTQLLKRNFEKTNALYEQVQNPQEAAQDSRLYALNTEIFYERTKKLKMGATVELDPEEFVSHMALFVYGDRLQNGADADDDDTGFEDDDYQGWARLGDLSASFSIRPAVHEFLASHAEPKARRNVGTRSTQGSQFTAAVTRPQELTQNDIVQNDNGTNQAVLSVMRIIKQLDEPTSLIRLAFNPLSYSQTVENLFNIAFLVRDQKIQLYEDEDGDLIVQDVDLINADTKEGRRLLEDSLATSKQFIFELDLNTWKDLIDAYQIGEPLIPTRAPTVPAVSNGTNSWYG
ncbi:Nse4 C-terminal-domain-containing protein [Myxozyma melibiosi]|uniref:Non-structural maintenance of chromosomes element 4 n=1 Tax=Myxozyma melibiosi TaxID=54550 RepID=A0ABR1FBB3_9ASCO